MFLMTSRGYFSLFPFFPPSWPGNQQNIQAVYEGKQFTSIKAYSVFSVY